MPAPLIPIALALAQAAAPALAGKVVGWIAGDESGAVAERVVSTAVGATGAETPEEALARVREDAAARERLHVALLVQEQELERLYLADRQSARERDVAIRRAGDGSNRRGDVLATVAILGLLATIAALFLLEVPPEARDPLLVTIGGLLSIVKDVYAFEFGSSRGSKAKEQTIAAVTQARAAPSPPAGASAKPSWMQ